MSFEPIVSYGPPSGTSNVFSYDRGTHLRVFTNYCGVVEGWILRSPSENRHRLFLELEGTVRIYSDGRIEKVGLIRLSNEDIRRAEIIEKADMKEFNVRQETATLEALCKTVVIDQSDDFDDLISELKTVSEVGLNFYGVFVGRLGDVGWICLYVQGCIVCIDVLQLEDERSDIWDELNEVLFSNEAITKVIYNSRPIVDYIYHKFNFPLKTVFDLQVAEFFLWTYGRDLDNIRSNKNDLKYHPLRGMLRLFLSEDVLPEELELLEWFDQLDHSKDNPLMLRPVPDARLCKCVAIEMKYLIRLKECLEQQMQIKLLDCMKVQMEGIALSNHAEMENQLKAPLSVPGMVVERMTMYPKKPKGKDKALKSEDCAAKDETLVLEGAKDENLVLEGAKVETLALEGAKSAKTESKNSTADVPKIRLPPGGGGRGRGRGRGSPLQAKPASLLMPGLFMPGSSP